MSETEEEFIASLKPCVRKVPRPGLYLFMLIFGLPLHLTVAGLLGLFEGFENWRHELRLIKRQ